MAKGKTTVEKEEGSEIKGIWDYVGVTFIIESRLEEAGARRTTVGRS